MSHSNEERLHNATLALSLIMRDLGDRAFNEVWFATDEGQFQNIHVTTWNLLEDNYYIKDASTMTSREFQLTANGWAEGIRITGQTSKINEYAGQMMAAIKEEVKGRRDMHFMHASEVAAKTGIPMPMLTNLLESDWIRFNFKRKGVQFEQMMGDCLLKVPPDFGLELL